jgi:hypothetical protein
MKTAVEWLESEFVKLEHKIGVHNEMYKLIEQSKEMEKEQIKNAFHQDRDSLSHYEDGSAFEEYYNETFKKK